MKNVNCSHIIIRISWNSYKQKRKRNTFNVRDAQNDTLRGSPVKTTLMCNFLLLSVPYTGVYRNKNRVHVRPAQAC